MSRLRISNDRGRVEIAYGIANPGFEHGISVDQPANGSCVIRIKGLLELSPSIGGFFVKHAPEPILTKCGGE
jgi:hypothetical protein